MFHQNGQHFFGDMHRGCVEDRVAFEIDKDDMLLDAFSNVHGIHLSFQHIHNKLHLIYIIFYVLPQWTLVHHRTLEPVKSMKIVLSCGVFFVDDIRGDVFWFVFLEKDSWQVSIQNGKTAARRWKG
jgi:hypothetical protein